MPETAAITHDLAFLAEGVDPGAARVRRLHAREALSQPFTVDVELELTDLSLSPRAWLHGPAQVVVHRPSDGAAIRRFGGVVTRVRERVSRTPRQEVVVTVESPLALLRLSTDHRIFQEKTTEAIVAELLEEAGIEPGKVSFRLVGAYEPREVCTQFGETTLAFASRLLEEDGIFHFVEQGEDGPVLVFADDASAYLATSPEDQLDFRAGSGLLAGEAITSIREREQVRPAKVTLRDHDFKRPSLDLEASAHSEAPLGREDYIYPGRYTDPDEGKRRAQIRLDALAAQAAAAEGTSNVFSLAAGHTFSLSGAPDAALDRAWVVTDLEQIWETSGEGMTFFNAFRLLPKETTFRPPAVTPRAAVPGPQVATVTGPAGSEIHCDSFGRVKVQFPWDRRGSKDENSSCWIRVGQMHASGSVAVPRVGWEVLVEFEDGDPDRPILVGRLYNGKKGPPYPLPARQAVSSLTSASTPGGAGRNEIRLDDAAGSEQFHIHAQRDLNAVTANNRTEKVANSGAHSVGADHTLKVGANETLSVGANHQLSVGAGQTWSVGGSREKTVAGNEKLTIKGSRTLSIGGSHTLMTPLSVSETTPASFSETVGGSVVEAAALGVSTAVAGVASFTVGGAKIEAVATGRGDVTVGAQATTVGGAFISASSKDVSVSVGGAKATTVGGAFAASVGGDVELSSEASLNITVGGLVALNAGSIVLKVGGSKVTLASGAVVIKSREIRLAATGPHPELAPLVADK
ncbi:MAG TPA: type VI secretion system tip protein TssI/VgrG [Bacilli bacterium]|nr:type VI secretion system tip protein TssI/VgrG [Bacilli bacterium]